MVDGSDFRGISGIRRRAVAKPPGCPCVPDFAPPRSQPSGPGQPKGFPMNPTDVVQSVLPLTSSDLSLFSLFWQAHWIVKTVMIGLMGCSVWVWAIAIDKTV